MDPYGGPVEDQSTVLRNLEISLITFSTVFLTIRLYSRIGYTKNAALDDVIAVVAWVLLLPGKTLRLSTQADMAIGFHLYTVEFGARW
jgi:hypothetical protein